MRSSRDRRQQRQGHRGKCDVGIEKDILALFKAADEFGTLGALVNNAGIVGTGVRGSTRCRPSASSR